MRDVLKILVMKIVNNKQHTRIAVAFACWGFGLFLSQKTIKS